MRDTVAHGTESAPSRPSATRTSVWRKLASTITEADRADMGIESPVPPRMRLPGFSIPFTAARLLVETEHEFVGR